MITFMLMKYLNLPPTHRKSSNEGYYRRGVSIVAACAIGVSACSGDNDVMDFLGELSGQTSKEYTIKTVSALATARAADNCPAGEDVSLSDVKLQAVNAPEGEYNAVEGNDFFLVDLPDEPNPALSGGPYDLAGTIKSGDKTCYLAVDGYTKR